MREELSVKHIISAIKEIAKDMKDESAFLNDLDSAVGDGDLGVTITLGMNAVQEGLKDLEDKDVGTILMRSGMNFNRAASSTFGTLIAAALMKAGKVVAGRHEISPKDMIQMLDVAEKDVRERGRANVGDKTMLDALVPLKEAFEKAINLEEGVRTALNKAYEAGEQGVEKTKDMETRVGRGRWLGERSMGHPDPGAAALLLILRSFINKLDKMDDV